MNGEDVKNYDKESLRHMVGVVPQKAVLFNGTIADNLRWGKEDATEEEMWQALSVAKAKDFVEENFNSLDTLVTMVKRLQEE